MITRKGISLLLAAMLLMSAALAFLPAAARAESSAAIIEGTDKITRGSTVWYGVLPEGESYDYDQANQPISWRVLDVNGSKELPVSGSGQALLISHKILSQMMAFGESNVWADSAAKTWCGAFGTALGAEADAAAQTSVTEENTVEGWYFYKGGHYNEYYGAASLSGEKFFCLSAKEADTYFTDDNDRKASGGSRDWWLRSPLAFVNFTVGLVVIVGWVGTSGCDNIIPGVRPAFNLNLESVLFTSAAEGGKSSGSGASALTEVGAYSGKDWKLTLKDSGRSGFTASATSREGDVWTIEYSGAKTGGTEFISAVIKDSSGNITYYGRLGSASASGTVEVDTGGKLNGGTLYVYNEQYNGNKKTDFASELKEITEPEPAPADVSYAVTKGAGQTWTKGSGKKADFTVTRKPDDSPAYDLFDKLLCDGAEVPADSYSTASGSLKLSLKAQYLETLGEGTHTLRFEFEDGYAETRLKIKASSAKPEEVPKTGDTSHPWLLIVLSAAALCGLVLTGRAAKKAKRNR